MERRKILIATKTYPSISTKYQETVCTAGVLLDDDEKPVQWIRIYPIRFRQLDFDKRYPRWSIGIVYPLLIKMQYLNFIVTEVKNED